MKWKVPSLPPNRRLKKLVLGWTWVILCLTACTGRPYVGPDGSSTASNTDLQPGDKPYTASGSGSHSRMNWGRFLLPDMPVIELECLEGKGQIYGIDDAGYGQFAVLCGFYHEPDGNTEWNESDDVVWDTKLYIIDAARDKIVTEIQCGESEYYLATRPNGDYVFIDYMESTYKIYDPTLILKDSFAYPGGNPIYNRDEDCIFYIDDSTLGRISMDGSNRIVFSVDARTHIVAYDPEQQLVIVNGEGTDDTRSEEYSVYSLELQEYVYEEAVQYGYYQFQSNMLVSCTEQENQSVITVEDPVTGGNRRSYYLPENDYSELLGSSSYMVAVDYPESENMSSSFYLVDVCQGGYADLTSDLENPSYTVQGYSEDLDCILLGCIEEGSDTVRLLLLNPERMEDWKDLNVHTVFENQGFEYQLGTQYSEERKIADQIEERYGVRILMGNECLNAAENGYYDIVSFEDPDYVWSEWDPEVMDGLETLERALAYYPEDFFETFLNYRGEGGLRILIVGEFVNSGGDFVPGGLFFDSGAWYNIAIDIDMLDSTDVVHHELWHAVEQRIMDEDYTAFDPGEWSDLNPPGYEYEEDFDNYAGSGDKYDYLIPWNYENEAVEQVYFTEIYGTVTPYEDRATLIEQLLLETYDQELYGYESARERIYHYPHLRDKLDCMGKYVEQVFGGVYWE